MKLRIVLLACVFAAPANAAVTSLTVEKIAPLPGGYELLEGHFSGALDPNDPHNAIINDIKLAPQECRRQGRIYRHLRHRPAHGRHLRRAGL